MGKHDLVKAVAQKLMKIWKIPALFLSCHSQNYQGNCQVLEHLTPLEKNTFVTT